MWLIRKYRYVKKNPRAKCNDLHNRVACVFFLALFDDVLAPRQTVLQFSLVADTVDASPETLPSTKAFFTQDGSRQFGFCGSF